MTENEKQHELNKAMMEFEHTAKIKETLNNLGPKPNGWLFVLIGLAILFWLVYILRT
jgi:hypothetical protein